MKILFTVFVLIAFTFSVSAQKITDLPKTVKYDPNLKIELPKDMDISPVKEINRVELKKSGFNSPLAANLDTMSTFVERSSGAALYTVTIQNFPFALTGFNPLYNYIGSKFNFTGNAKLNGILVPFAVAFTQNTADTLQMVAFSGNASTGLPETTLGATLYFASLVDTSIQSPVFTYMPFLDDISVTSKFAVMFLVNNGDINNFDRIYFWTNTQGDGNNENSIACMIYQNNQWYVMTLAALAEQVGLTINGDPPDMDLLFLPVLDLASDVKEPATINGITVKPVYPNPAVDNTALELSFKKQTNLHIRLIDANGVLVKEIANGNYSGDNKFDIDLNNVAQGTYFVSVESPGSRFALKLNVVK